MLTLAGCYGPTPHAGAPCGEGGACPTPLVCAVSTSTCEIDPSTIDPPGDGGASDGKLTDGTIEPSPDAPDLCFGTGLVTTCLDSVPTMPLTVGSSMAIDTSNNANCTMMIGASPELCVIAATKIDIDGTFRAGGNRALVLISMTDIDVGPSGTIDVASRRTGGVGAGADVGCGAGTAPTSDGGGYGGSFSGKGGDGGDGITKIVTVGDGGVASPAATPAAQLRGGCPGSAGGSSGGAGGHGGGGMYLIARTRISVAGTLNASGAGGGGCTDACGGGGGGAGGMIGLDAPEIAITAAAEVMANGGGGGEGSYTAASDAGDDPSSAAAAAAGGSGASSGGGDGGAGAAGATRNGGNGGGASLTNPPGAGGGGGGGAAGVIKIHGAADIDGAVSPPPS